MNFNVLDNPFRIGDIVTMVPENFYESGRCFGPWKVRETLDNCCILTRTTPIGNEFEDYHASFQSDYLMPWDGKQHGHGFHQMGLCNYSQNYLIFWNGHPYRETIIRDWSKLGELVQDYELEVTKVNIRAEAAIIRHHDTMSKKPNESFFNLYDYRKGWKYPNEIGKPRQYPSLLGPNLTLIKTYFKLHQSLLYALEKAIEA